MADAELTVIDNPSEQDRREAFPIPRDCPMLQRVTEPRDSNVLCGACKRVVAGGLTLLDLWEQMKRPVDYDRLLLRCTCGAHLLVPCKGTAEPVTAQGILSGTQTFGALRKRKPRRPEPDLRRS